MTIHIIDLSPATTKPQSSPAITAKQLKAVLDGMLYGRVARSSNSLEHLTLVDQIIADPTFPQGEHSRIIALGTILTAQITNRLLHYRRMLGISEEPTNTSYERVLLAIACDGQTSNRELIGVSWLYYRYVRIELHLAMQDFCRAVHLNERTIGRYQANALERLTEQLIQQEWEARRSHQHARQ